MWLRGGCSKECGKALTGACLDCIHFIAPSFVQGRCRARLHCILTPLSFSHPPPPQVLSAEGGKTLADEL